MCWPETMESPGLQFSYYQPLDGHDCVGYHETGGPPDWEDNFMCIPKNELYELQFVENENDFGDYHKVENCINLSFDDSACEKIDEAVYSRKKRYLITPTEETGTLFPGTATTAITIIQPF